MSFGENSKPAANSDLYRDNFDKIFKGKKKKKVKKGKNK